MNCANHPNVRCDRILPNLRETAVRELRARCSRRGLLRELPG